MREGLTAGFGRGTIHFPAEIFPLEGFRAVHDDPHARLMVLKSGNEGFALLALELVICPEDMIEAWQKRIGEAFGLPTKKVWVHVNHTITTPHEPHPRCPRGVKVEPTPEDIRKKALYRTAVEAAVTEAIDSCSADMAPAALGWGSGECHVNGNRDVETPYGWWVGKAGDGPSNHTLTVLRVNGGNNNMLGIVLFYALKPCAADNSGMRDNIRLVSSEVTGAALNALEKRFGVPAIFCMTAAGDQVPVKQSLIDEVVGEGQFRQLDEGPERGLEYAAELGAELASAAADAAEKITCGDAGGIGWSHMEFTWPRRQGGVRRPAKEIEHIPKGEGTVTAELFCLGNNALVAAKPEINTVTETQLLAASPFERTVLVTMVNGDMKYMPDAESFEHATFEAQSAMLMPGAAERFVKETAHALSKML